MLQSLIKHELLVCAVRGARPTAYQVDCFASPWIDPEKVGDVFRRDTAFVTHLATQWTESEFHPVVFAAGGAEPLARGPFAAELQRLGTEGVLAHGTYDALGKPVSLFVLATMPCDFDREQAFPLELIAPFLHLAWMRSQLSGPLEESGTTAQSADPLTAREKEILRWNSFPRAVTASTLCAVVPLSPRGRSEAHTSSLQPPYDLVYRLLLDTIKSM